MRKPSLQQALFNACKTGNLKKLNKLIQTEQGQKLDSGLSINEPNSMGKTALFLAVENGHYECALTLCRRKAENLPCFLYYNQTPLHLLIQQLHALTDPDKIQCILTLIRSISDYCDQKNILNQTPLFLALQDNPSEACLIAAHILFFEKKVNPRIEVSKDPAHSNTAQLLIDQLNPLQREIFTQGRMTTSHTLTIGEKSDSSPEEVKQETLRRREEEEEEKLARADCLRSPAEVLGHDRPWSSLFATKSTRNATHCYDPHMPPCEAANIQLYEQLDQQLRKCPKYYRDDARYPIPRHIIPPYLPSPVKPH